MCGPTLEKWLFGGSPPQQGRRDEPGAHRQSLTDEALIENSEKLTPLPS